MVRGQRTGLPASWTWSANPRGAGQDDKSSDHVVPGYCQQLLDDDSRGHLLFARDRAEAAMMGKLVVRLDRAWAREYKIRRLPLRPHGPPKVTSWRAQNSLDA